MNRSNNDRNRYICLKMNYLNVDTSNKFTIMITIDTATRGPIEWTTIGGTAGKSSDINTTTIATFKDTASTSNIITTIDVTKITTITIDTINGTTSVINKVTSDTRANVSESAVTNKNGSKRWIRAWAEGAITIIQIIITNIIPFIEPELTESVGFNKYDDNFIIIHDR